jgi:hypothetical protein
MEMKNSDRKLYLKILMCYIANEIFDKFYIFFLFLYHQQFRL